LKKAGLLLLILAAMLFWWLQSEPNSPPKPSAVINQVSKGNSPTHAPRKSPHKPSNRESETQTIPAQIEQEPTQAADESERSYLDIFHDIRLAQTCERFYLRQASQADYDHLADLDNVINGQYQITTGATTAQADALEQYIDDCFQLAQTVSQRTNGFYDPQIQSPVLFALEQELAQAKPQTAAEQHLHRSLVLADQWQQSLDQLLQTSQGAFVHTREEQRALQQQIDELHAQITQLYQFTDQVSNEDVAAIYEQIQQLQKLKNQRQAVDSQLREQQLATFQSLTTQLQQLLIRGYPDAYLTAINALDANNQQANYQLFAPNMANEESKRLMTTFVPEYQSPSQQLMTITGIQDQQVFDLLLRPASLLMMCLLGDDCGPDSIYMRFYCTGDQYHRDSHAEACGLSLVDFYSQHYLSPNQWQDVSDLLAQMEQTYAP